MSGSEETNQRLAKIETTLDNIQKVLLGNGQPGLVANFNELKEKHQIVYDRQKNCQENHKQSKVDFKWVALFLVTIFALIKEFI